MSSLDLGFVQDIREALLKLTTSSYTEVKCNTRVQPSCISKTENGYLITLAQLFNKPLKIYFTGNGARLTKNGETVATSAVGYQSPKSFDISMIDGNHSWKVVVTSDLSYDQFIRSTVIEGIFVRQPLEILRSVSVDTTIREYPESKDMPLSQVTLKADEARQRIFSRILSCLDEKFIECDNIATREKIPIILSSPSTPALQKYLTAHGYYCELGDGCLWVSL